MKTLDQLAERLNVLKREESLLKAKRIEAEEELIALIGSKKEGSVTTKSHAFSVTVTCKISRKLDAEKWEEIKDKIPEDLNPIRYKPEVNKKAVDDMMKYKPEIYKVFCQCIETKPAKTAVSVKML